MVFASVQELRGKSRDALITWVHQELSLLNTSQKRVQWNWELLAPGAGPTSATMGGETIENQP